MANKTRLSRLLSTISLILGLWLLLSPGILGYHMFDATAQQIIIGSIIVMVAGARVALPAIHWPSWIGVLMSVELIVIPLNVGIDNGPIHWNTTMTGLVLLILALQSATRWQLTPRRSHTSHS